MKTIMERSAQRQTDSPRAGPNIAILQRLMNMVETGGSLLPFGKLKHARNWARMMRYWQHGVWVSRRSMGSSNQHLTSAA
jgi:hypothetical protein